MQTKVKECRYRLRRYSVSDHIPDLFEAIYLNLASSCLVLNIIKSIGAIAYVVLLDKLLGMSSTLGRYPRHIPHNTQVYDELLVKVTLRSRPRIQTLH